MKNTGPNSLDMGLPLSEKSNRQKTEILSGQISSLLFPVFRQYRLRLFFGLAALLGVDLFQLLVPRYIKGAIDDLGSGTATQAGLFHYAVFILLLAVGIAVCRFFWRYLIIGFSRLLERDLRNRLMSHLLTLDSRFFQRYSTGELMALATNDLNAVQLAAGMGVIAFVDALVMTIAALSFMAYINPTLTFIAVVPMPILAVATRKLSGRLHKRFKKVQEQFSKMTECARSTLSSIHLIKAYTQEGSQKKIFGSMGESYIRDNMNVAMVQGILFPLSGLVANCCLLLVLFFGGRLTIEQTITIGDFVAFIAYLFMLTWPMMAIGWVVNLFQRGSTSLGRIHSIMQESSCLPDPEPCGRSPEKPQKISLRHLTFSYPGQGESALDDITFDIGPGLTGVVGKTGSGKSTLCHVLARLYPVAVGNYCLENIDVNELPLQAVRSKLAYVPQQTILFSDTIEFNISLGKQNATLEQIKEVARAAAIHDEIMALENGYQARVGEKGVKLSGGQRQRIALARALILDRDIIIIDDGLSAVDMETEHQIIRSIASYLKGRICIVVSHRVAPLIESGEIFVMDGGRIVARGSHEDLLGTNEFYRTIYTHQNTTRGGQR